MLSKKKVSIHLPLLAFIQLQDRSSFPYRENCPRDASGEIWEMGNPGLPPTVCKSSLARDSLGEMAVVSVLWLRRTWTATACYGLCSHRVLVKLAVQEDYDRFENDKLEQEKEKLEEDNQKLKRENKVLKQKMQQLQALQACKDDRSDTCTILSLS